MATSRGITSSRAYWELKTDQVMDRVFAASTPAIRAAAAPLGSVDSAPIDVVVRDEPPWRPQPAGVAATSPEPKRGQPPLVLALLALLSLLGIGTTLLLWQQWSISNQALVQERNLQLLERLRSLGAAPPDSGSAIAPPAAIAALGGAEGLPVDPSLPPPPPQEPWLQELGSLEGGGQAIQARPLLVPLRGTLQRPVPAAPVLGNARPIGVGESVSPAFGAGAGAGAVAIGSAPELVGVVQANGRGGSAIFSLEGNATSTAVGEPIGSTGWRLHSTSGDSVVIERNGQQQRVSIGGSP
ncbi:hypothetical protein [Cyanobium sp. ULC082]